MIKLGFKSLLYSQQIQKPEESFSERKRSILLKLVSNGYNVIYLDPKTVVKQDILLRARQYAATNGTDIIIGINGKDEKDLALEKTPFPSLDSNVLYIKPTIGAQGFLENLKDIMNKDINLDFQSAVNSLVKDGKKVKITGFGRSKADPLYPDGQLESMLSKLDNPSKIFARDLEFLFQQASTPPNDPIKLTRIHIFDPVEFISGKIYFKNLKSVLSKNASIALIHASDDEDVKQLFKIHNLWFLDSRGECKTF